MDKQTCVKYLTLTASLLNQIYQKTETNMEAFGTHYIEHFFSKLRRLSHGDNCSDIFIWSLISNFVFEELSKNNSINISIPKRTSSSGVSLKPNNVQVFAPFKNSMKETLKLFSKYMNFESYKHLFPLQIEDNPHYDFFEDNFSQYKKPETFISTRKSCMIATGGFNQFPKFESHRQMKVLIEGDTHEKL